ncbi:hypothetical protein [Actinokineospora inagensis]|uniref:hypothetical protein n=1 Tax=Actinokineospora inagensis TaxID=103730 RepID=UPI00041447B1|nr:hypothetical protein [Actinokineospora inagensis]
MAYSAPQIIQLINSGTGPSGMYAGGDKSAEPSTLHHEIADEMLQLQGAMGEHWQGDAAGQAYAGASPLVQASRVSGDHLTQAQGLYTGQGSSFKDLQNKVAAVGHLGNKPADDWVSGTPLSFMSNRSTEINAWNQKSRQVIDAYTLYHGQSTDNSGRWATPSLYGELALPPAGGDIKPPVPADGGQPPGLSTGPGSYSPSGGGRVPGHSAADSGYRGSSQGGGHRPGTVAPPSGGAGHLVANTPAHNSGPPSPNNTTLPNNATLPGNTTAPGNTTPPDYTTTAGYLPSTPSGGDYNSSPGGYGPGGSNPGLGGPGGNPEGGALPGSGFGPDGARTGAGTGSGVGRGSGTGPEIGAGTGNRVGAGTPGGLGAGGRLTSGPMGGSGHPGGSGMGGVGAAGHGGRGDGAEDTEHETPEYLQEADPDNALVGPLPKLMPPVIGAPERSRGAGDGP